MYKLSKKILISSRCRTRDHREMAIVLQRIEIKKKEKKETEDRSTDLKVFLGSHEFLALPIIEILTIGDDLLNDYRERFWIF